MRLHLTGMAAGFQLPIRDGPLIEVKGRDDRRSRAAIGQQGQHNEHHPDRMFETVQERAGRVGECPIAGMTDVAAFTVRMDANAVACATIGVGAYYQLRAQGWECVFGHTTQ